MAKTDGHGDTRTQGRQHSAGPTVRQKKKTVHHGWRQNAQHSLASMICSQNSQKSVPMGHFDYSTDTLVEQPLEISSWMEPSLSVPSPRAQKSTETWSACLLPGSLNSQHVASCVCRETQIVSQWMASSVSLNATFPPCSAEPSSSGSARVGENWLFE